MSIKPNEVTNDQVSLVQQTSLEKCGVVMPIAAMDGCSEGHWTDVFAIISDAIEAAGFEANLVSNADDVGIIQKRIIQNLYENPVIVCDVSGKNANVMFELGMRLAFDKPTIIIKDDKTSYSFDTAPIEHLEYPRDLRFNQVVEFKSKLAEKIKATYKKSKEDKSYTTFLKHFGEFTVAKLDKKEVSGQEYILDELRMMRSVLRRLERSRYEASNSNQQHDSVSTTNSDEQDICVADKTDTEVDELAESLSRLSYVNAVRREKRSDHYHLIVKVNLPVGLSKDRLKAYLGKEKLRFQN